MSITQCSAANHPMTRRPRRGIPVILVITVLVLTAVLPADQTVAAATLLTVISAAMAPMVRPLRLE